MSLSPHQSPVVIYVNGAVSPEEHSAAAGRQSVGDLSGAAAGYDPYRVHREFPERWSSYIRANYRNLAHVTQVFQVSEKTARNWWEGVTGAVGGHVAIAVREHPVEAPAMLFAAE